MIFPIFVIFGELHRCSFQNVRSAVLVAGREPVHSWSAHFGGAALGIQNFLAPSQTHREPPPLQVGAGRARTSYFANHRHQVDLLFQIQDEQNTRSLCRSVCAVRQCGARGVRLERARGERAVQDGHREGAAPGRQVSDAAAHGGHRLLPRHSPRSLHQPRHHQRCGVICRQGETWHRLRSLLTPELTSSRTMHKFLPELTVVADDFSRLVMHSREGPNGLVRGFEELACRIGLESTCTLILGKRLGFLEKEVSPLAARLAEAVKDLFCASRDTFFGLPFWKLLPTPAYRKFMSSENTIYDVISELVDSAQKQEEDTCELDDAVQSVFMAILRAPGLDLRDKKAGIIDFIAAGIKTLGNTLVFLLYLMAKNKQCQEKLYEEIWRLAPNGASLDSATLRNAHYLRACIMEAFRVLPTAPCVARILESDVQLGGYHLKSGSVVLCHTWLACMDEANFEDAKVFSPERWLGSDGNCSTGNSHPFLVVPFGVGRRMCPGKRFVELELQVVLALMVRQFEIDFEGHLELEFEFLLAPKSPANFLFKERVYD
ncbi:cytochrome P450 family 24 subfamily A member shade isoform X2 [Rhodnius prolixus]|uniref:cytochrome P450 family 24 subfamily A member shade isoform X2 n=1 Tax=Rhodnius prolixus TaxID=13249 RepID=UPI003D18DD98